MDSDNKDHLFLLLGVALMAMLTLFCSFLWLNFAPNAIEVGIALGIAMILLIIDVPVAATCLTVAGLKLGRFLLWAAMLGYFAAIVLAILRVAGVIM